RVDLNVFSSWIGASASRRLASAAPTHVFQRGGCSLMPRSWVWKNAKFSCSNAFGSIGAEAFSSRQRTYVFRSSSGASDQVVLSASKNLGQPTLTASNAGAWAAERYASKSIAGTIALSSVAVRRLSRFFG